MNVWGSQYHLHQWDLLLSKHALDYVFLLLFRTLLVHFWECSSLILEDGLKDQLCLRYQVEGSHVMSLFSLKGTPVIPLLCSTHFDSLLWATPEEFSPGHFLDKKGEFWKRDDFMPFSAGNIVDLHIHAVGWGPRVDAGRATRIYLKKIKSCRSPL